VYFTDKTRHIRGAVPAGYHTAKKMSAAKKGQQPFWLGGAAASMAACFTHPLDQTKYRMQVQASKQNIVRALVGYAGRDGVFSLWSGLSASLLRQSTYSTARFGVYNYLAQQAKELSGTKQLSLGSTITCAGLAGGIAGVIGNPTEV
jgi:solute carrier family 25 (mitochondrial dicarboxylate transporter), member 10